MFLLPSRRRGSCPGKLCDLIEKRFIVTPFARARAFSFLIRGRKSPTREIISLARYSTEGGYLVNSGMAAADAEPNQYETVKCPAPPPDRSHTYLFRNVSVTVLPTREETNRRNDFFFFLSFVFFPFFFNFPADAEKRSFKRSRRRANDMTKIRDNADEKR